MKKKRNIKSGDLTEVELRLFSRNNLNVGNDTFVEIESIQFNRLGKFI
jgi:hypothetical protein